MHYDRTRHYGFETLLAPQGLNQGNMDGKGQRRNPSDLTPRPGIAERFSEFHTGDTSKGMEHDNEVTRSASGFIQNRSSTDRPFFLLAGYITPHFPLIVPDSYWKPFAGKVPPPNLPEGILDALPLNYRHLRIGFNMEDVPPEVVTLGRELYYGLVQWFDEQVGRLLHALDSSGAADNTVVIYTSDHGENMGEHGLWWKNAAYESASHIPLIVSWPARWNGGQRRTGVCSLLDVVQTIVELAGGSRLTDWHGDSLVTYLDDPKVDWKNFAVSEYYAHNIASGFVMIREDTLKYVYHTPPGADYKAQRELFDLSVDPDELTNLALHPDRLGDMDRLHAKLVKEVGEDPEETEHRCRADLAKGYV
ncbi:MAG: hypothetical protein AMXMBFR84_49290 [Candidatus Hydrogenedentota bacterium]